MEVNLAELYEKRKAVCEKNIQIAHDRLRTAEKKLEQIKSSNDEKKQKRIEAQEKLVGRLKNNLEQRQDYLRFLRAPTQEDIDYRINVQNDFPKNVRNAIDANVCLCFHGTSIYNAEKIVRCGSLSSSSDRLGFETSYDVSDQVSVTVPETLETTIGGYSGLEQIELPAGCVFVVKPKDENEVSTAKTSMLIGNVDFNAEPERLVAIVSTSENMERLKQWCEQSKTDYSKTAILDYDQFIEFAKEKFGTKERVL